MVEQVNSKTVTVINQQGLHARPADMLVRRAQQFESEIVLVKDGEEVDGKSILSILTLAAEHGTQLSIQARGADAQQAVAALAELFERGFDSDQAAPPSAN